MKNHKQKQKKKEDKMLKRVKRETYLTPGSTDATPNEKFISSLPTRIRSYGPMKVDPIYLIM